MLYRIKTLKELKRKGCYVDCEGNLYSETEGIVLFPREFELLGKLIRGGSYGRNKSFCGSNWEFCCPAMAVELVTSELIKLLWE